MKGAADVPRQTSGQKEAEVPASVTYSVPDMSCDHCKAAVTTALTDVSGVESVDVDLGGKVVTVSGESLDDVALRAAIADAGYETA
jgi:copper chaperone CopZ